MNYDPFLTIPAWMTLRFHHKRLMSFLATQTAPPATESKEEKFPVRHKFTRTETDSGECSRQTGENTQKRRKIDPIKMLSPCR